MPFHKKYRKCFRVDGQLNAFCAYLVKAINSCLTSPVKFSAIICAGLIVLLYDHEFRQAFFQRIIGVLEGKPRKFD